MNSKSFSHWLSRSYIPPWGQTFYFVWTALVDQTASVRTLLFGLFQLQRTLQFCLKGVAAPVLVGTAMGQTDFYQRSHVKDSFPAYEGSAPGHSAPFDPRARNLFEPEAESQATVENFLQSREQPFETSRIASPASDSDHAIPLLLPQGHRLSSAEWMELHRRLEMAESRVLRMETELLNAPPAPLFAPSADDLDYYGSDYLKRLQKELKGLPRDGPSYNLSGQVQLDHITYDQSQSSKENYGNLENATGIRRSRLGVYGELYETTEYRIEWDFASNGRPRMLDNWISLKSLPTPVIHNIIVGYFFEPFSLERYSPNRFTTFMERSLVDTFAPARGLGVMAYGHGEDANVTWASGIFRSGSNEYGDSVNDSSDFALTSHLTWLPYFCESTEGRYLWHWGLSHSYRAIGDKQVRYRTRPEANLQALTDFNQPFLIDSGVISADAVNLIGAESAIVWGPFSVQFEAMMAHVNRLDGRAPTFWGYYAYASYFLTGENRSYSKTNILGRFREGIFQRIKPRSIALKGDVDAGEPEGTGAWEIAARYSYLDLDSRDVDGNTMSGVTLGLNWYINANTRVQWNYIHNMVQDRNLGPSNSNIFGMRLGYEW